MWGKPSGYHKTNVMWNVNLILLNFTSHPTMLFFHPSSDYDILIDVCKYCRSSTHLHNRIFDSFSFHFLYCSHGQCLVSGVCAFLCAHIPLPLMFSLPMFDVVILPLLHISLGRWLLWVTAWLSIRGPLVLSTRCELCLFNPHPSLNTSHIIKQCLWIKCGFRLVPKSQSPC